MEKAIVSGISHKTDEAKVTVSGVENRPGVAARIFTALADRNLHVDTIIQNVSDVRGADVSFTVPLDELAPALDTLGGMRGDVGYRELSSDDQIGKVTLVGAGMKSEPGVAAKMFRVLADEGINLQMIDTSTIRITVVIDRREVERAVGALHDAFDLASEAARREAAEAVVPRRMFATSPSWAPPARSGGTVLRVLEERGFPVTELRPLASARSEGLALDYLGRPRAVRRLTEDAFEGIQIAVSLGRRDALARVRPRGRRGRCGRDRQVERVPHGPRRCRWSCPR